MFKNNLGYPRVGTQRQLKKACEQFWNGKIKSQQLLDSADTVEEDGWKTQAEASIDLIPVNDFSLYDQVLDMVLILGAIPERYSPLVKHQRNNGDRCSELDLYFAMARGHQKDGLDITPMEMTKWFDTNYHYIVPEFTAFQKFELFSEKVFSSFTRAKSILKNQIPKPVLIGPLSFLLLGKEKGEEFDRLDLLPSLLPIYIKILNQLKNLGAEWIQLDEPYLALDLSDKAKQLYQTAYDAFNTECPGLKILIATYFDGIYDNSTVALKLPVSSIHLDLIRAPQQLELFLALLKKSNEASNLIISLGVIDGRNIWKNDYEKSLSLIQKTIDEIGKNRVMISPSCSLFHVPFDLDFETELKPEMKNWMAFAKQKLHEIDDLYQIASTELGDKSLLLECNRKAIASRRESKVVHNPLIKKRVAEIKLEDTRRKSKFEIRQKVQRERFNLPFFPTTTIGSFPQTTDIRQLRAKLRTGELSQAQYERAIEEATIEVIRWQEDLGIDVLVHGEFERNDMVEYFGELLEGFLFTKNGWVTSYGSRCVKPPVIYGDVNRPLDMTVRWSAFAQSQTCKLMKGMLTGPVTILQWSFVRDDQPRFETAYQIALAIRNEVIALEKAGLKIIQIDEPAIREGLPLRYQNWKQYLDWAVKAFHIASSGVNDETQIHTHMCYSEFNDIIDHIASMDADVITIENSRSQMELLQAFANFQYPNEIGPGVYDIHSPRIPSVDEIFILLENASRLLPPYNLWVNPDCGLKTRSWIEVKSSLANMVEAARRARQRLIDQTN